MLDPQSRPKLDLAAALDALDRHRVRWVLTGSLVLISYGARLEPGDLDITPSLEPENLEAIAELATELQAIPLHEPTWPQCPPLEWHYEWVPIPPTVENLDHLLVTSVGRLDIVPELCGSYDELAPGASPMIVGGHEVLVADPRSVLDRLMGRNRAKDQARQQQVDSVRAAVEAGTASLSGLDHIL